MQTFVRGRRLSLVVAAVLALGSAMAGSQGTLAARRIDLHEFMTGLACVESSGKFTAVNERSGAIGKYQIMPRNWPAWSARYLRDRWAQPTPRNQEFVARERVKALYELHGSWRLVAKWWRTGNAEADESLWTQASRNYVDRVMRWARWAATPRLMHLVPDACFPKDIRDPEIRSEPWPRAWVKGGRIYVRQGAGVEHRAFDVIKRGTRLAVLGSGIDAHGQPWLRVGLRDGSVGWVSAWYTTTVRPQAAER